jgi:hypothetical protein
MFWPELEFLKHLELELYFYPEFNKLLELESYPESETHEKMKLQSPERYSYSASTD